MGCINTIQKEATIPKSEDPETKSQSTNPSPSLRASINSGDSITITPSLLSLNSIFSPRYDQILQQQMENRFRYSFESNISPDKSNELQPTFNRIHSTSFSTEIKNLIDIDTNQQLNNENNKLDTRIITTLECNMEEALEQQKRLLMQMEAQNKLDFENKSIDYINPHYYYDDYHDTPQSE
eukprot:UN00938